MLLSIRIRNDTQKICIFSPTQRDLSSTCTVITRIDECQVANDWNDTTTYANFSLCLKGEADEWLASKVRLLELTAAQQTWTRIRPLFKKCAIVPFVPPPLGGCNNNPDLIRSIVDTSIWLSEMPSFPLSETMSVGCHDEPSLFIISPVIFSGPKTPQNSMV